MSDSSDDQEYDTALVLDMGSGSVKCGFAGRDAPQVVVPCVVGRIAGSEECFIGEEALRRRDTAELSFPLEHGKIDHWEDVEKIWAHCFAKLEANPREHPVLLTEAPLNPLRNREKMAELMFEAFHVPALNVTLQAVLAIYCSGRTTGIVLDSGDGVTHVVPVVEGFPIQRAVKRLDLGGRDVTDYLLGLINDAAAKAGGRTFSTLAEREMIREVKERYCRVAAEYEAAIRGWNTPPVVHRLPDGTELQLGSEVIRAPEAMFRPEFVGMERTTALGVPELVHRSIADCDIDTRRDLYGAIVLSGGNTMFPGFSERTLAGVTELGPRDSSAVKVKLSAPANRQFSVWIGGAMAASLPHHHWISKADYTEQGPSVLHRHTMDGRNTTGGR